VRELVAQAERAAAVLLARKETVAVAESSAGGLITAALLAVPGASAWCTGSADRLANMHRFAEAALQLFVDTLG